MENVVSVEDELERRWNVLRENINNDDGDRPEQFSDLIAEYDRCDPATQGIINYVLIAVCGWSLPTLLGIADGLDDNPEDMPYTVPSTVRGHAPTVVIKLVP
jgi:hypothetical protein